MSMTSYRNSEQIWEENQDSDVSYRVAGLLRYEASLVNDFRINNHLTPKQYYKKAVYYAKYYTENADPIYETAKRGMLFQ